MAMRTFVSPCLLYGLFLLRIGPGEIRLCSLLHMCGVARLAREVNTYNKFCVCRTSRHSPAALLFLQQLPLCILQGATLIVKTC